MPGETKNQFPLTRSALSTRAAQKQIYQSQFSLALCYAEGRGVAKDEVEAYRWDLPAAAQGDNRAKRSASKLELMLSQEQISEGKRRAVLPLCQ